MNRCFIYINIDNEPIFPRTEERLRIQAKELADYLGIEILDFDHRKDNYTFGWHAIGMFDDITVVITYPSSLEEDDDWNEVVADDRYNLYVVFEQRGAQYNIENHDADKKIFSCLVRKILKEKLPFCYHISSLEFDRINKEPYINENFMNEE